MEFKEFSDRLRAHVAGVLASDAHLFEVAVDKDALWETYLAAFPPGTNEMYRKRREFDCSCCRHFIKAFGHVVAIKDNRVVTMWDFAVDDPKYTPVLAALAAFVRAHPIADVFVTDVRGFGTEVTRELTPDKAVVEWHHFHVDLPKTFQIYPRLNIGTVRGQLRDVRNVFERSLRELTQDAIEAVLELIAQKSLYKGEEWDGVLRQFLALHRAYHALPEGERALYCWATSLAVGPVIGKIKNHSIGVLLANISAGMDLDEAVQAYERIVAPTNYKRPKAVFTKRMVEDAQRTIEGLGLAEALERRYATLDDIRVPNILFANRDAQRRMTGGVFEQLAAETGGAKKFGKLDEVAIDDFVRDILPKATGVELFVENAHVGNLVSLIAPKNGCDKTLFKWGNGFSWAYRGNITDSMKERVKAAGGKVDGVLRFSIQWNDDGKNQNDFDAHCVEPNGNRIYFGQKIGHRSGGNLDVDIIQPMSRVAVENITWPNRARMQHGVYTFGVHNFTHRGGRDGFTAEIEFDGQLHKFAYDKEIRHKDFVTVAEVELLASGEFRLTPKLPSNVSSQEVWGLKTNQFHPVTVAMYSPNYWDAQDGIGHRHYFFMLSGCRNEEAPNGFFNEFLREDLMAHKRVFEALGAKMRVALAPDQLSGVGFSATKHAAFVCKVEGAFQRTLKVNI